MAVPANAQRFRMAPLKAGVMLGVSPSSDPTFDMEIARATSSGVYTTVTRLTGKGLGVPVVFTDILPVDNFTRSYKARAVKDGWKEGDYTSVVSAKPVELPEITPNVTPLTGKGIGSPLFVSTGAPVTVGQKVATSNVRKYLTIPFTSLIKDPLSSGTLLYDMGLSAPIAREASPTTGGTRGVLSAVLPPGVTIRSLLLSGKIVNASTAAGSTSGDWVTANVFLAQTDFGGGSTFAQLKIFTTSAMTNLLTGLSVVASTDNMLSARVVVRRVSPLLGNEAGFSALTVGYDMPSYDKAL